MSVHRADSFDEQAKVPHVSASSLFFINDEATTEDFPEHGPVAEFLASTKVNTALHALADKGILSAPVWDEKENRYLGFCDVFDLMTLVVGVDLLAHLLPDSMLNKKQRIDDKVTSTLGSILKEGDGGFCKWTPVMEGTKFKEVVRLLATGSRRIPVLSKTTGRVIKIISQSAVVAALYDKIRASGEKVLIDTPATTGIGLKPVAVVKETDEARTAFQMMVDLRISAVGVLDSQTGELLTCISSKDIRMVPKLESALMGGKNVLDLSCREFVALVRKTTETTGKSHASVVTVGTNTPLSIVLGKLAATKMHRVFIIDDARKPVGVVSVSDVLVSLQEVQPTTGASAPAASGGR